MPNLRTLRAPLALFGFAFCGCGSEGDPVKKPVRSIDYELFPSTRQLGDDELGRLSDAKEDGTLRFDRPNAALEELEVGQVVLAGISKSTPQGLLRVVLSAATDESGALTVRTAAAPLQLAFKRLHARVADVTDPFTDGTAFESTDQRPLSLRPQFSTGGDIGDRESFDIVVFDGDDNLDTTNDQVRIKTTLGGGFEFDLAIDVDWGAVDDLPDVVTDCLTSAANLLEGKPPTCNIDELMPELKLALEVDPHLEAKVALTGAATTGYSQDFDVGTILLPPIPLGPLVFQPTADIVATIEGSASARFSAEAHASIKTATRVTLSSKAKNTKIVPFEVKETDAGAETPEVDLYADARVKAGVRFTLALYGVVGPYAKVSAVSALTANPQSDPCWDFHVGLEAALGVIIKTPSLPVVGALTFLDWGTGPIGLFDKSLANGSCDVTPEGASPPPGGGPTAKTLQTPPFTPWAKLLDGPADGSDLASVLAYPTGFPSLIPTIDGRYVASGGTADGLVKLDGEGVTVWDHGLVSASGKALRSLGSVASTDAGLVTLYRSNGTSAFVLAKYGQSGALHRAVTVSLPDDCNATPQAVVRDGTSGFVVVGECQYLPAAWLVHLDVDLAITGARTLSDQDAQTVRVTPTAVTRSGDELVVAGEVVRQGEAAGELGFVVRFSDDDSLGRASAFACPDRLSFYPSAVIPSLQGSLTLVGDANGIGFVARIKADGALGFARFPNLGGGIQSGFAPNSVVELPTTGLVVASTVSGLGDTPTDVIVVGLDGAGRTQWGREYTLHGKTALRGFGWPSAVLTDDGGILLGATAAGDASGAGQLFAMKVFARDGTLPDGPLVTSTSITPQEDELVVEPRTFEPTLKATLATLEDFDGTVR